MAFYDFLRVHKDCLCNDSDIKMNNETDIKFVPSILAPAGNKASFLAALAAGADAIYCGLKDFSARMEAKNFSIEELTPLTQLAHAKGVKVYVALKFPFKAG